MFPEPTFNKMNGSMFFIYHCSIILPWHGVKNIFLFSCVRELEKWFMWQLLTLWKLIIYNNVTTSAWKSSIWRFVSTEKAPTRAFSWLKAATTAFTFKTQLRHYAKRALTPRSLNMKLGPRRNYYKGRAAIRHYANQTKPFSIVS